MYFAQQVCIWLFEHLKLKLGKEPLKKGRLCRCYQGIHDTCFGLSFLFAFAKKPFFIDRDTLNSFSLTREIDIRQGSY